MPRATAGGRRPVRRSVRRRAANRADGIPALASFGSLRPSSTRQLACPIARASIPARHRPSLHRDRRNAHGCACQPPRLGATSPTAQARRSCPRLRRRTGRSCHPGQRHREVDQPRQQPPTQRRDHQARSQIRRSHPTIITPPQRTSQSAGAAARPESHIGRAQSSQRSRPADAAQIGSGVGLVQ